MPGKIILDITEGVMLGKRFEFDQHDTFIFGRMPDCHMCLPDDGYISRYHFILEANPPEARIRDIGSMNGTYVNERKYGGREEEETPEDGAKRRYPEVSLEDGDQIKVGNTVFSITVEQSMLCCECGRELKGQNHEQFVWIGGTFICPECKKKNINKAQKPKIEPIRCQKCKKDVSKEVGANRRGAYICQSCRIKVDNNPRLLLQQILMGVADQRGHAGKLRAPIRHPGKSALNITGYEIEKELGRGGMGAVYLARSKKDKSRVAIKVMLAKGVVNEKSRKVFQREIDVTSELRHANIVEFIDHGSAGTVFYVVLEFCDKGSVDDLMRQHGGKLTLRIAAPIMLQSLEGLAYAHNKNFVHRDLKPQNILLTGSPGKLTTKIADLGLSKNFDDAGFSGMTMTGTTAGTPAFMPREQVLNYKYVKAVTDVWSIGATFYNMLTGQLPRIMKRGQDPMAVVLHGDIIPIRNCAPSIPEKVAKVIDRSLSGNTSDRYKTAAEMREALAKAL